jgi:bifunctional non-homologous end joining protein LigD
MPMLLSAAHVPPDPDRGWAYELKWDGMRALCAVDGPRVAIWSRHGTDFSSYFPELGGLAAALKGRTVVLDGELVCVGDDGRPSFARVRRRWLPAAGARATTLARRWPATFVAFDVLELGGQRLLDCPYEERRQALAGLGLADRHWIVTAHHVGSGAALLAASREQRFEGIVAKRLDSRYRPGRRSPHWLKIKNYQSAHFIIGGWVSSTASPLEALLVGQAHASGIVFAGTVEFGLQGNRRDLEQLLAVIPSSHSPFTSGYAPRGAHFVEPRLRARVRYIGWDAGVLREPIFESVALA